MTSPYITEAVRRAKLPIRVEYKPQPYGQIDLGYFVVTAKIRSSWNARWPSLDWSSRNATKSHLSLCTRLLQEQTP